MEWSKVTSGMVLGDQEAPGRWVGRWGLQFLGGGALLQAEAASSAQSW